VVALSACSVLSHYSQVPSLCIYCDLLQMGDTKKRVNSTLEEGNMIYTSWHFEHLFIQGANPAALGEAAPLLPALVPLSSVGGERLSVSTAAIPTLPSQTYDFWRMTHHIHETHESTGKMSRSPTPHFLRRAPCRRHASSRLDPTRWTPPVN